MSGVEQTFFPLEYSVLVPLFKCNELTSMSDHKLGNQMSPQTGILEMI